MSPRLIALLIFLGPSFSARAAEFQIATFTVDVTIPIGHPCMGGGISLARAVADPLFAKGVVLTGAEKPFVVIAFDWCEIRGTSFEKWKQALALAAETEPQRVLVTCIHHDDGLRRMRPRLHPDRARVPGKGWQPQRLGMNSARQRGGDEGGDPRGSEIGARAQSSRAFFAKMKSANIGMAMS